MPAWKTGWDLLKGTFSEFMEDECPRLAAALSYYTIFAMPPLLILLIMVAGAIWDPQTIQRALEGQFTELLGTDAARQVHDMIRLADRPDTGGVIPTLLGIGGLLFGATGAFFQLQGALNRAWDVEPDPAHGGIRNFLMKRLLSLGMALGVAFLLLVSLALTALVSAIGDAIGGGLAEPLLYVLNLALSLGAITLLFAAMFKILPDAKVAWRDVWAGAAATTVLLLIGKFLIGFYLGRSDPGDAYGAAGALAVILIWIYYAAMIVLIGAEFTQLWATRRGRPIEPEEGAVRVEKRKERIRTPESEPSREDQAREPA